MNVQIGLQSGTLEHELKQDFQGTLEKVARIGYQGVELGKLDDRKPDDVRKQLDRAGLKAIAIHTVRDWLEPELAQTIASCETLGCGFVIISWDYSNSIASIKEAAKVYNRLGETLRKHNIRLCYHNHDHEFQQLDGKYAMDYIMEETDPELVFFELDTYWAKKGGADPAPFLRKLSGRVPLVHFKDMEPGEERFFAEVGEGILDFGQISAESAAAGAEWFVVEQDECRRPRLESAVISFRNMQRMKWV